MERILLVMQADHASACIPALLSARRAASRADRLSIGLLLTHPTNESEQTTLRTLGLVRVAPMQNGLWQDYRTVWQGEPYLLMGHAAMRFKQGWDRELTLTLEECQAHHPYPAALTGLLPYPTQLVEANTPIAAIGFDPNGQVILGEGLPLRYAAAPQQCAFLNPGFCFARAGFFDTITSCKGDTSLIAWLNKCELYSLHKCVIHSLQKESLPPCRLSSEDGNAVRFAQRFGIDLPRRQLNAQAREGVWTIDLSFPAQVPFAVKLQELLRRIDSRSSRLDPLMVTAWMARPGDPDADRVMAHLRRLNAIKALPLLCYADTENLQRVKRSSTYVKEYKARYALPVSGRIQTADIPRYARLSQAFLLANSREKELTRTHLIWIAPDYLSYPVYEGAALDWETICTDRITLAQVAGELDLDMISVPEHRLLTLCREISALCDAIKLRTTRLPEERNIWNTLVHEHPEWFRLIDLPSKRELFSLTMTSRAETWLAQQPIEK